MLVQALEISGQERAFQRDARNRSDLEQLGAKARHYIFASNFILSY